MGPMKDVGCELVEPFNGSEMELEEFVDENISLLLFRVVEG